MQAPKRISKVTDWRLRHFFKEISKIKEDCEDFAIILLLTYGEESGEVLSFPIILLLEFYYPRFCWSVSF